MRSGQPHWWRRNIVCEGIRDIHNLCLFISSTSFLRSFNCFLIASHSADFLSNACFKSSYLAVWLSFRVSAISPSLLILVTAERHPLHTKTVFGFTPTQEYRKENWHMIQKPIFLVSSLFGHSSTLHSSFAFSLLSPMVCLHQSAGRKWQVQWSVTSNSDSSTWQNNFKITTKPPKIRQKLSPVLPGMFITMQTQVQDDIESSNFRP